MAARRRPGIRLLHCTGVIRRHRVRAISSETLCCSAGAASKNRCLIFRSGIQHCSVRPKILYRRAPIKSYTLSRMGAGMSIKTLSSGQSPDSFFKVRSAAEDLYQIPASSISTTESRRVMASRCKGSSRVPAIGDCKEAKRNRCLESRFTTNLTVEVQRLQTPSISSIGFFSAVEVTSVGSMRRPFERYRLRQDPVARRHTPSDFGEIAPRIDHQFRRTAIE